MLCPFYTNQENVLVLIYFTHLNSRAISAATSKKGIGICKACFSATFVVYIITTNVKMLFLTETKVNVKTGLLLLIIPSKET